jgi:hypothetical protein
MKTLGYLVFLTIGLAELIFCALNPTAILNLQVWQIVLLGWGAFRSGRALSDNSIFSWLREPFCDVVPDSSGAGDSVVPRSEAQGIRYVIGDWFACPICISFHTAAFILVLLTVWTPLGLVALYALGASGIAETIHWFTEKVEWEGRLARELAGNEWLAKNENVDEDNRTRMRQLPNIEPHKQRHPRTNGEHARAH